MLSNDPLNPKHYRSVVSGWFFRSASFHRRSLIWLNSLYLPIFHRACISWNVCMDCWIRIEKLKFASQRWELLLPSTIYTGRLIFRVSNNNDRLFWLWIIYRKINFFTLTRSRKSIVNIMSIVDMGDMTTGNY